MALPGHRLREELQMAIEFYDVKLREKVQIPESEVKKTTYEREGKNGKTNVRYAFKAVNQGTKLTKFASKEDWDALDAPVE
jgi:hypothetical protein